jgi:electron transfer flavoprotein alpha subunit
MKTLIITTSSDSCNTSRELISAAKRAGATQIKIAAFTSRVDDTQKLPVDEVALLGDLQSSLAEMYLSQLLPLVQAESPTLLLFAGHLLGDSLAARLGALLHGSCATQLTHFEPIEGGLSFSRQVFGLRVSASFTSLRTPFVFSIAANSFACDTSVGNPKIIRQDSVLQLPSWLFTFEERSSVLRNLDSYRTVLVCGRGMNSRQAVERLQKLAKALQAGVGATRPAVLNGWADVSSMIGISGSLIAPDLCITFGVSGSTPFLKGVEKSKMLIAVNSDPNAPIFRFCDIGVVADCNAVLDRLLALSELARTGGPPN